MPKIIDGTWKGEAGKKQIKEWEESQSKSANDGVNNPPHYTKGSLETIEVMEEQMSKERFLGYLEGNIIKYVSRYEHKKNPIEDLKKAQWYMNKLVEKREKYNTMIEMSKHIT